MDVSWWLLTALALVTQGSRSSEVTQEAHDVVVTINTLRPVTQTSDKFLGISTSPRQLLNDGEYSVGAVNMLQALSPGYLRVGGPESDHLAFTAPTNSSSYIIFTESQWMKINQLAVDTGLHLIFSLSPTSQGQSQLLRYSEHKGYNVTWQLGYCLAGNNNETAEMSPRALAQEVLNLRRLIESIPRYQNTAVLSPDIEFCEDSKCLEDYKAFLLQANDAIDIAVLQTKPQGSLKEIKSMFEKLDKLALEIEISSFNRNIVLQKKKDSMRKNIWISEAAAADFRGGLSEMMSSALSLGLSSRLGYQTFLLHLQHLSPPSPSYWPALLWRALVGRAVLGARLWPQDAETAVFAACTETQPQQTLDTEWEYEAGAVTLWGVNAAEQSTRVLLRTGSRLDHVHLYLLTADDRNSGNVLLNGRPLRVVHGVVPRLSPRVRSISRSMSVTVPPQTVFFIVLPDAQAPACFNGASRKPENPLKKGLFATVPNIPIIIPKGSSLSEKLKTQSDDIFFEKGWIFNDATEKENKLENDNKTEVKENIQEGLQAVPDNEGKYVETKFDQSKKSINQTKDSNGFSGSYIVQSIANSISSNKNNLLELSSKKTSEILKNDQQVKSSNTSSVVTYDNKAKLNGTIEPEVPRVKRSQDYSYFEQTGVIDTETSPLYRRVNLLRQILNKMQHQTQLQRENKNNFFHKFAGIDGTLNSKNTKISKEIGEKYSVYPLETSTIRTNRIDKEQTSIVEPSKNVENINYLPGEFYEVLGGLKLDSNTSLKDKEEIIEATESVQNQKEPQKCDYEESKLTVTKKPENDPQEDKRLVEHATENSKQYYMTNSYTTEQKVRQVKTKDNEGKSLNNKKDKASLTIQNEYMGENVEKTELNSEKFFKNPIKEEKEENAAIVKPKTKRTKRDTFTMVKTGLTQSLKSSQDNEKNQNKYLDTDYSDEIELRRFLEELTNEGEQLLQTIDEEYENNIGNSSFETGVNQFLTSESVSNPSKDKSLLDHDQYIAENNTEESDFYLKNNILVDNEVKPKRKYHPLDTNPLDYISFNQYNKTIETNDLESKNQHSTTTAGLIFGSIASETDYLPKDEPSLSTKLITSDDLNYPMTTNTNKSITEEIDYPLTFTESIIPVTQMETTKPGTNQTSNSNLEFSDNLLYNYSESSNTAHNFSKVLETGKENTNVLGRENKETEQKIIENSSLPSYETDEHEVKIKNKGKLVSTKQLLDPITVTEQNLDERKLFDIESKYTSISDSLLTSNNMNTHNVEEHKKIDNKSIDSEQQQATQDSISKTIPTISSYYDNTTTEKTVEKKNRIDSKSKLENKILPPPLKSTMSLRPLSVPSVLTLNRNLSLPKKIDVINSKITEFNNKHKLSLPVLEKNFSINSSFSDKYKERLEALKQRLHKARERFLNLTSPKTTQLPNNSLKLKREIIFKGKLNSLVNDQKNKEETQMPKNLFDLALSKQPKQSLIKYSSSGHRFKRQLYEENENESSLSIEDNSDQAENLESEVYPPRKSFANILTPYYFSAIKKWIIPLSNNTENIFYKDKLLPVNLYGIVSDKWVREHIDKMSNTGEKRQRRAIQYPCVKDKFNDFDTEENNKFEWSSNDNNDKMLSIAKRARTHSVADSEKTKLDTTIPQSDITRSRRATNQDIEKNEMEMKALLTNEIVKEKPSNDVSESESVFSSMLHKTLSKTVTNKTGIERMFELAKQYKETNPSSLEIFSAKNKQPIKRKFPMKNHNEFDEENAAIEITDNTNVHDSVTTNQMNNTEIPQRKPVLEETEGVKNSSLTENLPEDDEKRNEKEQNTPEDAWSDFFNKIQDFFETITTQIKKEIM